MKNILTPALAFGLIFCAGLHAAAADPGGCNDGALLGSYIFFVTGTDHDGKPFARAGMEYYDGKGNMVFTETLATGDRVNGAGSYQVDRSCRARVRYSDQTTYNFFVAPAGEVFDWVATSGNAIAGAEKRVSKDNLVGAK